MVKRAWPLFQDSAAAPASDKFPPIRVVYRGLSHAGIDSQRTDKLEEASECEVIGDEYPQARHLAVDHIWSVDPR